MNKPKVLIVARYAGPANALAQVARILIADNRVTTVVIGFSHAAPVFRQHELPLWAVDDDEETPGVADKILEKERPDLVLTGTSLRPRLDGAFWHGARERHIATVALMDHWTNYSERFSEGTRPYAYLPDTIAVMDEIARRAMVDTGCPPERIVITGQPAFDYYTSLSPDSERELRELGRRELGVPEESALVIFASEPHAKYNGSGPSSSTFLGYTEQDSLRLVLDAVAGLSNSLSRSVQVVVKLHPLETSDRLRSVAEQNQKVAMRILQHYSSRKLIAAADVVTGMTSVFLLEAALSGKRAVSVQPSRKRQDDFTDHQRELIDRTDDASELQKTLARALNEDDSTRQRRRELALAHGFDGQAGLRVAELIYNELGLRATTAVSP